MTRNPHAEPRPGRRPAARIIGLVVALVLVAVAATIVWRQAGDLPQAASSSPARSAPSSPSPAAPTRAAVPAGCMARQQPITPAAMKIDRMKVSSPVMSLGLDADNAAAAPPKDEPRAVAWYNRGPRPGSATGKVVLSIHTYHDGGALGNELRQPGSGLTRGDLIRMTDASGRQACYRYDHNIKVMVKDYDPDSDIIYDDHGRPMLAIVICWDYDSSRNDWDSRIVFYATPVTA